jgi:hypothetical protein
MMRTFMLSILITSSPVFAGDWVMLPVPDPVSNAAGETFFVDPDISTVGKWPTIHTLRNYRQPTARGHASDSMVCEVDCNQRLIRAVGGAFYSGLLGKGAIEPWNRHTPWVRPAVDTALDKVLEYACTEKKSQ